MAKILREIGISAWALDSIANIEFKEYDLTRGQYLYLIRFCRNPGIIQEKLAKMINGERTTASNGVALRGLSDEEAQVLFGLLQRVRKNVEGDWEYVKKGTTETTEVRIRRALP